MSNAAKTLFTNVRFMDVDNPVRTVVITSSIPNEGKSYVAQILSEAIATSGKTCLLIEGDLRRRTLGARLGVHPRRGLYAVLAGDCSVGEAVSRTQVDNLYFLDAEPNIPNPSDLFASHRFSRFLTGLAHSYDYVVIDTPPVNAFVDAAVLSYLADATLLVVRENFTHRDQVRFAIEQLHKTGGKVSGIVMNYCKHQSSEYYYNYYYKDYNEQGGKDSQGVPFRPLEEKREPKEAAPAASVPSIPVGVPSPADSGVMPTFKTQVGHGAPHAMPQRPAQQQASPASVNPYAQDGQNPYAQGGSMGAKGFVPANEKSSGGVFRSKKKNK